MSESEFHNTLQSWKKEKTRRNKQDGMNKQGGNMCCCVITGPNPGAPEPPRPPRPRSGCNLGNSEIFCHFQKYKAQVCRTNGSKVTTDSHFWALYGPAMSLSIWNVNRRLNVSHTQTLKLGNCQLENSKNWHRPLLNAPIWKIRWQLA